MAAWTKKRAWAWQRCSGGVREDDGAAEVLRWSGGIGEDNGVRRLPHSSAHTVK
jgi:hypothetical protein